MKNLSPDASDSPPTVPGYGLLQQIGSGAYGEVWLGEELLTGVRRAVKVLTKGDRTRRETVPLRELEGIRLYQQKSRDHPSLVQILHVGETGDSFFYVMELADNASDDDAAYHPHTLSDVIRSEAPLPASRALALCREILIGLAHLHGQGLLHRDVKPSNVLFIDGQAKLADLGLVTSSDREVTMVGTPGYLPPDAKLDQTADLYAVGIMLYEMITGLHRERFPELPVLAPRTRRERKALRASIRIFNKAANPNRKARYESANQALDDVSKMRQPSIGRIPKSIAAVGLAVACILLMTWATWSPDTSSAALASPRFMTAANHETDRTILMLEFENGYKKPVVLSELLSKALGNRTWVVGSTPFVPVGTRSTQDGQACNLVLVDPTLNAHRQFTRAPLTLALRRMAPWTHQGFGGCGVDPIGIVDLLGGDGVEELLALVSYDFGPTNILVLTAAEATPAFSYWHYGNLSVAGIVDTNGDGSLDIIVDGFANERPPNAVGRVSEPGHVAVMTLDIVSSNGGWWAMNDSMCNLHHPPLAYGYIEDAVPAPEPGKPAIGWTLREAKVNAAQAASIQITFTNDMLIELTGHLRLLAGPRPASLGSAGVPGVVPGGRWIRTWPREDAEKDRASPRE